MLKSTFAQDYLLVTLITSFIISSFLTVTALPIISIGVGFLLGMIVPRIIYKKKWNNLEFKELPVWKRYCIAAVTSLIGSQIGWAALLV